MMAYVLIVAMLLVGADAGDAPRTADLDRPTLEAMALQLWRATRTRQQQLETERAGNAKLQEQIDEKEATLRFKTMNPVAAQEEAARRQSEAQQASGDDAPPTAPPADAPPRPAFTSPREIMKLVPAELLRNFTGRNDATTTEFNTFAQREIVGRAFDGDFTLRSANIQIADEAGVRRVNVTSETDSTNDTVTGRAIHWVVHYRTTIGNEDSPLLRVRKGDTYHLKGRVTSVRASLAGDGLWISLYLSD